MATAPPVLPNTVDNTNQTNSNVNQNKEDNTLPEVTVTATQTQANVAGNLTASDDITPQPNVLDRFASYTYSASVYLMSNVQYQAFLRGSKKNLNGYFLLFQSGGAPVNKGGFLGKGSGSVGGQDPNADFVNDGTEDYGRNPAFPQDFYIDSMTIENALPGKLTQSPHFVTDLKFTVVEPGNITLLDRLYRAVQDVAQVDNNNEPINYTAAAYLMVIRWYGYDINGNQIAVGAADPNTGLTDPNAVVEKFIPFIITNINWQVSSRLVTYDFECAPIGQWVAGSTRRGTIPFDAEFSARTVSELLGDNLKYVSSTAPADNPGATTTTGGNSSGGVFGNPNYSPSAIAGSTTPAPPKASTAPTSSLTIKQGLMGAMNAYQQQLVKDGIYTVADTYAIEFGKHPDFPEYDIGESLLKLTGNVVTQSNTPMGVAPSQNANQALSPATNPMNSVARKWSITSGMQLVQVIDQAVRKSSYIYNQQLTVIDAKTNKEAPNPEATKKPMIWFEISMEAYQGKYDRKRNDFAYDVIFFVTPYPLQNFDSKYFPLTEFRGIHKAYPYWFTGQNTAVIDFTASFNSLYNVTVTGTKKSESGAEIIRESTTASMREIPFYTHAPSSTEDRQGEEGRALEAQANAAEYLYSPGDMGTCNLRIIGDPAWIQQGSISGGVSLKEFSYSAFLPDGSINFDAQQVMFEISWQRPNDYNLNTGLADPYAGGNTKDRLPIQSTVYSAQKVVSEFRQGKFEQTIEGALYMFPKPDGTNTVGKSVATNNGNNEGTTETAQLTRQNAQSPSAESATAETTAATNFNNTLYNNIRTSAAFTNTGTMPVASAPLNSVGGSASLSSLQNNNFNIGPSAYPQAPTGSGVNPIVFSDNSPEPLNTNPFANAGRTQTIVREA